MEKVGQRLSQTFVTKRSDYYNFAETSRQRSSTSKTIHNPIGLDFSTEGELFVAEMGTRAVRRFDKAGKEVSLIGTNLIIAPKDVAISVNDGVFIANTEDNQTDIVVLSTEGHRLDRWGRGYFQYPRGVCVTQRGHVMVSDKELARVSEHDQDGKLVSVLSPSRKHSSGKLKKPTFVRVDTRGRILVTDRGKNELKAFSPEGKVLFTVNPKKNIPKRHQGKRECILQGVTSDDKCNIYVALYHEGVVNQYDPSGKFMQTLFDNVEAPIVQWPVGLSFDHNKKILAISESYVPKSHSCVKCFDLNSQ